jgi:transposase
VEQIIRIGMDTSKHIFQLHGVDAAKRPVRRGKLRRGALLGVGELRKLGHEGS